MNLNILIVDDDRKLLSVLKTMLVGEGHKVFTCSDGLIAINALNENKYDLVITDLKMPGADGFEVLKEARRLDSGIIVILITGFGSLETAVQAIRRGAYDYITKPFKLEEIKILVDNAAEKISLIKENQRLIDELHEAYKQLHMMKRIMNAEDDTGDGTSIKDEQDSDLVITGSMLPLYYKDKQEGVDPHFLSSLERISDLRDKGHLSEEEFNLCKMNLLENLKQK